MDEPTYTIWISEAKNDFEGGKVLMKSKRYNLAVFHFSQAAEKAVKALLYLEGAKPWGHTILNLLLEYEKKGHAIPATLKQHAKELEKSYLDSRYPEVSLAIGPKDKYDKKSTTEAMNKAKDILDFVTHEKEALMKGGTAAKTP
nr:HEPN domain-containing protein [Candidatus Sigynarchaeum springense]